MQTNRTEMKIETPSRKLAQDAQVDPVVALIALEHARGNMRVARDYLSNEVCRSRFIREAREYGRYE